MVQAAAAPQFEVEILVNGRIAQEYDDDDAQSTPNSVTKYVESVSDSAWSVKVTIKAGGTVANYAWVVQLNCDGQVLPAGMYIYVPEYHNKMLAKNGRFVSELRDFPYAENGRTYTREFKFSKTDTTEEALTNSHKDTLARLAKMGKVEVTLWRCSGNGSQVSYTPRTLGTMQSGGLKLPEKALKGRSMSHNISVSEKKAAGVQYTRTNQKLSERPEATYTFKYLSKAALKGLGIIESTPEPEPANDDDLERMTAEQLRAQLRSIRSRETASEGTKYKIELHKRLKREAPEDAQDDVDGDDVVVIDAPKSKARKIECVDLT